MGAQEQVWFCDSRLLTPYFPSHERKAQNEGIHSVLKMCKIGFHEQLDPPKPIAVGPQTTHNAFLEQWGLPLSA